MSICFPSTPWPQMPSNWATPRMDTVKERWSAHYLLPRDLYGTFLQRYVAPVGTRWNTDLILCSLDNTFGALVKVSNEMLKCCLFLWGINCSCTLSLPDINQTLALSHGGQFLQSAGKARSAHVFFTFFDILLGYTVYTYTVYVLAM